MTAAFFRNKRRKLDEQNKVLKDSIVKCPKDNKDVTLETCLKCTYSKKDDTSDKLKLICKYK